MTNYKKKKKKKFGVIIALRGWAHWCLGYVAISRPTTAEPDLETGCANLILLSGLLEKNFHIPPKVKDAIDNEYARLNSLPRHFP